jgi:hypothetical protein
MFSVVCGITGSGHAELAARVSVSEDQFDRAHIELGRRAISRRLREDPEWAKAAGGVEDIELDLTSEDLDIDEFRALAAG